MRPQLKFSCVQKGGKKKETKTRFKYRIFKSNFTCQGSHQDLMVKKYFHDLPTEPVTTAVNSRLSQSAIPGSNLCAKEQWWVKCPVLFSGLITELCTRLVLEESICWHSASLASARAALLVAGISGHHIRARKKAKLKKKKNPILSPFINKGA